uniref:Uncharacterized protein n=1 Tax=Anguilla anguilla TaxID=7936 RepID=A0A0E9VVI6_ANGAN
MLVHLGSSSLFGPARYRPGMILHECSPRCDLSNILHICL